MPSVELKAEFSTLIVPPDSEEVGTCVWEFRWNAVLRFGAQKLRACATLRSWICGLTRAIWMPRFCSRASFTASSDDRRLTVALGCAAAAWIAAVVSSRGAVWPNAGTANDRSAAEVAAVMAEGIERC